MFLFSGAFFGGPPGQVLQAWRDGDIQLVASPEILREYAEVVGRLGMRYPSVETANITELIASHCRVVESPPLTAPISADPDDDKFIACALASGTSIIISGDAHLLNVQGVADLEITKPADFVANHLL